MGGVLNTVSNAFTGGGGDPILGGTLGAAGIKSPFFNKNDPYQTDPGAKPIYEGYDVIPGSSNDLIAGGKGNLNVNVSPDTQALDAIQGEALAAPGQSRFEQYARQQQALDEAARNNQVAAQGNAAAANARSALASHGGLSAGTAERMARGSMADTLNAQQGVAQQGQQARAQIASQAEANRLQQLMSLPQMQEQLANQKVGQQEFNIQNALNQKAAQEASKLQKYQMDMAAWAAANQANAIGASGPKYGGILGGTLGNMFGGGSSGGLLGGLM